MIVREEIDDRSDAKLVEGVIGHQKRIGALLDHCNEGVVELIELRTATGISVRPNVSTAACNWASWAGWEALSGFQRKATREREGMTSLRSCKRLPATSGPRMVFPVILPPGRARLDTSPAPTGSPIPIMMMGIVVVACLAARVGGVPNVAMR